SKGVADGHTRTDVRILDLTGRIEELATMVGAPGDGSSARDHARDLLRNAEAWKREARDAERGAP
ncbi:MAG: hypothetical protein ACRDIY_05495, partial [Chloroflexota bacterium]